MNQSMITATVTMGQLQKKLDTISNNVANVNTNGFKRRDVQFQDLLFQQLNNQIVNAQETGRNTPLGLRVGTGARVSQTHLRMDQGAIIQTGRPLDVAFAEKNLLFEVLSPEGPPRFTRDGAFYFTPNPNNDNEVFLVTGNGDYVMSETGQAITIPARHESIKISETGRILVTMKDGNNVDTEQEVARLQIVRATKPQLLQNIGDNYFTFPNLEELGLTFDDVLENVPGTVIQGALEGSNVDMGKELSDLILAQRAYQFNTRSISIADQMMGLVNNIRG
ncbi:flagellar hook-basal body protein [Anaerobacillus isosaccharinicus]|uniref:Flagellar biosynthesis protein FlgG n=1 Tax=Anaerobacillus isosaccharinicus TaxID=1532552 RepID=A0A1S2M6T7_9BACI|nr:flagellar hook-basal body protein [Anaerobacillus isosaccharinicus]MBA5584398.1 flagellar hook-basal body protein [Anaerobacillus isosaccharinicus]QOY37210.1 flagellar hook-basal body protein [Anaerobacillus isosaccharinicus]